MISRIVVQVNRCVRKQFFCSRHDATTIRPYIYVHFEQFLCSNFLKEVSWLQKQKGVVKNNDNNKSIFSKENNGWKYRDSIELWNPDTESWTLSPDLKLSEERAYFGHLSVPSHLLCWSSEAIDNFNRVSFWYWMKYTINSSDLNHIWKPLNRTKLFHQCYFLSIPHLSNT